MKWRVGHLYYPGVLTPFLVEKLRLRLLNDHPSNLIFKILPFSRPLKKTQNTCLSPLISHVVIIFVVIKTDLSQ